MRDRARLQLLLMEPAARGNDGALVSMVAPPMPPKVRQLRDSTVSACETPERRTLDLDRAPRPFPFDLGPCCSLSGSGDSRHCTGRNTRGNTPIPRTIPNALRRHGGAFPTRQLRGEIFRLTGQGTIAPGVRRQRPPSAHHRPARRLPRTMAKNQPPRGAPPSAASDAPSHAPNSPQSRPITVLLLTAIVSAPAHHHSTTAPGGSVLLGCGSTPHPITARLRVCPPTPKANRPVGDRKKRGGAARRQQPPAS